RRKDLVIASALIADPRVMLLDEPTIGRDLLGMHRLDAVIAGFLRRGGAVLATTHDRRWARESSHRLLHLAEGRLSRPCPIPPWEGFSSATVPALPRRPVLCWNGRTTGGEEER